MSTLAARNMCGLPLVLPITEKGIQSPRHPLPSTTKDSQKSATRYSLCTAGQLRRKASKGEMLCKHSARKDKSTGHAWGQHHAYHLWTHPFWTCTALSECKLYWITSHGERVSSSPPSSLPCFIFPLTYKQLTSDTAHTVHLLFPTRKYATKLTFTAILLIVILPRD